MPKKAKASSAKLKQSQKQLQNVKIVINEDKRTRRKPASTSSKASAKPSNQPERYTTPEQRMRMQQTYAPPSISYLNNAPNSEIMNLLRASLSAIPQANRAPIAIAENVNPMRVAPVVVPDAPAIAPVVAAPVVPRVPRVPRVPPVAPGIAPPSAPRIIEPPSAPRIIEPPSAPRIEPAGIEISSDPGRMFWNRDPTRVEDDGAGVGSYETPPRRRPTPVRIPMPEISEIVPVDEAPQPVSNTQIVPRADFTIDVPQRDMQPVKPSPMKKMVNAFKNILSPRKKNNPKQKEQEMIESTLMNKPVPNVSSSLVFEIPRKFNELQSYDTIPIPPFRGTAPEIPPGGLKKRTELSKDVPVPLDINLDTNTKEFGRRKDGALDGRTKEGRAAKAKGFLPYMNTSLVPYVPRK